MIRRLAFATLLFASAAHCGGITSVESSTPPVEAPDGGPPAMGSDAAALGGDAGAPCSSDSDCSTGTRCAYSAALACGWHEQRCSAGTCQKPVGPEPCPIVTTVTACGCDGKEVTWTGACGAIFAPPFGPVPFAHLGSCAPTGAPCTSTSECGAGEFCGFAAAAGCQAVGRCVSSGSCDCNNVCCASSRAVGCDGAPVEVSCVGFAASPVCGPGSVCD